MSVWEPQDGPQVEAIMCPADAIMYGGSRGGGKTDCALGRHLLGAQRYGRHWNGIILRRKYADFAELRRRIDELIEKGMPAVRIGGEQQPNYVRFSNGATITLLAIMRLDMVSDLVGRQFTEITFEEATTLPFFRQAYDKMLGSLRSPHGVPTHVFITGNPGGPGHASVKEMFVDAAPAGTVFYDKSGRSHVFIRSRVDDNRVLVENDPTYVNRLKSISDPALRRAWLEGDWDVFIGQAFHFTAAHNVIEPIPVPESAPLYMTYDWGYGKPFSIGWWWIDNDRRAYRFAEWYGCSGSPDEGLRLTDEQVAEGIIDREKRLGIGGRRITRISGPDCFSKKPDYRGGGQGPSTAETFATYGLALIPGDPDRQQKIRRFREALRVKLDENGAIIERSMIVVYKTCAAFIRTIPALAIDEINPEDIDTEQEDHVYDESCHVLMARPVGNQAGVVSHGIERAFT